MSIIGSQVYLILPPKKNIDDHCNWTEKNDSELSDNLQILAQADPSSEAKKTREIQNHLHSLLDELNSSFNKLTSEKCVSYLSLKSDYTLKNAAAKAAAEKAFKDAPLEGVGSDIWKTMWESARAYSDQVVYKESTFPYLSDNALCVLCQQPLKVDAQNRLQSFEEFVKGDLEKKAASSKKILDENTNDLEQIIDDTKLDLMCAAAGITDTEIGNDIRSFVEALRLRKDSLLQAEKTDNISDLPSIKITEGLKRYDETLTSKAKSLDEAATNRKKIQKITSQLQAQKWLAQNSVIIKDKVSYLKTKTKYDEAIRLTKTTALSSKKSSISDEVITPKYQSRFQEELNALGANNIRVSIDKTRVAQGHVYHKIFLKDCCRDNVNASDVLSEGEFRIVSLSAFLADVSSSNSRTTFVFDDPISSLDQDFEEATIRRLVALAKERHVIVFTHRLSMLTLLQDQAKKANVDKSVSFLTKRGQYLGDPEDEPIDTMKPQKALNKLKNDKIPIIKKIYDEGSLEEYEDRVKTMCSKFRIILERIVERELLDQIVLRFRRSVQTDNRIMKLAIISEADCGLIDAMMTKYSRYEHSQPDETPVPMPPPDELGQDIESLLSWLKDFTVRKKTV